MISEVKKQLDKIIVQIETEKRIHEIWSTYKDCEIKAVIKNQAVGVIRGLEVAKESLEYILKQDKPFEEQMTTDEWMIREQEIKKVISSAPDDIDIVSYFHPSALSVSIERDGRVFVDGFQLSYDIETLKRMYRENNAK